jgi:hypothetical protein
MMKISFDFEDREPLASGRDPEAARRATPPLRER